MKKIIFPLFLLLTAINILLSAWSVLHNDIYLTSDIARDMFLLQEVAEKKLVLIGPRSSVGGLFHGPLWTYVTYPGYLIGNGNPVVIGWYWILLIVAFLVSCYFIAEKLFNKNTAMLFVLMTSLYLAFHSNALFNPYGAMFVIPAFFYFFVRYIETLKVKFLIFHLICIGALIQFQMAIGIPFLLLSTAYLTVFTYKKHRLRHLFSFLLIPLLLANFALFDLRHDHILINNFIRHLQTSDSTTNLFYLGMNRVLYIFQKLEFLRFGPPNGEFLSACIFVVFLLSQIKNKINNTIYFSFLYFFLGFFVLSLANRYNLLTFYVFPLLPFVFLIFSSFITSKAPRSFLVIFIIMYGFNLIGLFNYIKSLNEIIGKDQYSWKAVFAAAKAPFDENDPEFGYFVYAPDIMGYGPRYAATYAQRISTKRAYLFEKKPVTYLLIEPYSQTNEVTNETKFKKNQIHIYSKPTLIRKFDGGYKIERHLLVAEDMKLPIDPGVNPGLHYR